MQKETKEMLCACSISFLSGVIITLIICCCGMHMAHRPNFKHHKCPYSQQLRPENQFKHHNKLMGREHQKPPEIVAELPTPIPNTP